MEAARSSPPSSGWLRMVPHDYIFRAWPTFKTISEESLALMNSERPVVKAWLNAEEKVKRYVQY